MATLILGAAGAAIGGALGGSVLGISAAVLGRAVGATIGNAIDQRLLGAGSQVVQTGRAASLRMMGAREGNPVSRVYGRMRVTGQVIWSSRFKESSKTSGSGKGLAPAQPAVRSFSYSISFAVGLCEGEIVRVGRVWADGKAMKLKHVTMRVHRGTEDQMPDPLIEAIEGAADAPAGRGLAYLVFEDLALVEYGNRIPQISVEVFRRVGAPVADMIQGVALVPGTGEYALATVPVHYKLGKGKSRSANVNNASGRPDFVESFRQLQDELPNCGSVSLVVSWFGDDLRCDRCTVSPRVEQVSVDGSQAWVVSGQARAAARLASEVDGRPAFGGTPSDGSVLQAIRHLREHGKRVVFYPFVLMDIQAGNTLLDPWTGTEGQPPVPWRGRITLANAPGRPGSTDKTSWAFEEADHFFGFAEAADFSVAGDAVGYAGPDEWTYRRFILHYAQLCALAGGVDTFCLGSELRGLTQIRSGTSTFPVVTMLRTLAADVRAILGPACKITYAADWSEYSGFQPQDGTGDVLFHLDPLWADANVDFVGIDNYVPLSDWRNVAKHADAGWGSVYDLGYLQANIEGGEGFAWYYESEAKRDLQLRSPITDGAHGEPWVYRNKDFRNWWLNAHHNRIGGVRVAEPTAWVPQSKPLVFTELGCPAVNNGSNQPNMFVDAKSSESGLPWHSDGGQDDLIQASYLAAMLGYWRDPANNPAATGYIGPMVDMTRTHVWAWDARPWPDFPARTGVWADGGNYARGHWISGRIGNGTLTAVVADICAAAGVGDVDVAGLHGSVKGFEIASVESGRQSLQPLMLAYGFDGFEQDGKLVFRRRSGKVARALAPDAFAIVEEAAAFSVTRAGAAEASGRVRLGYVRGDAEYQPGTVEIADPLVTDATVSATEFPLVLSAGEGRQIVGRWIGESHVSRDQIAFALPPSRLEVNPGDVVQVGLPEGAALFRVDRIEEAGSRQVEAVRIAAGIYSAQPLVADGFVVPPVQAAAGVFAEWLDLPVLGDAESGALVAVSAEPWPGAVAVYGSASDAGYSLKARVETRSVVGETLENLAAAEAGLWMPGSVKVRVSGGVLTSHSAEDVLNGANVAALRAVGAPDWEVFQFRDAELVGPGEYRLRGLLRGQAGTEFLAGMVPAGADFVLLDGSASRLPLAGGARGLPRHYRVGPAGEPYDDASYQHQVWTFRDVSLRPYAPAHLRAERVDGGALAVTWVRRTRVDGDSWEGPEVPPGEAREAYQVRIGAGVREFETSAPSLSYSAVQQVADGVTAPFVIEVAQISDRFGAGPFTRIMFNG